MAPIMLVSAFPEDLCLSFANTRQWRGTDKPAETLHDIADLLRWIETTGGLGASVIRPIHDWADAHPKRAARMFSAAIELREAIYRAFSAVADGGPVANADLTALRDALADAPVRSSLDAAGDFYAWRTPPLQPEAPDLLAPVLWSVGDLLVRSTQRRIRRCANPECRWLFIDESRMGTRRWCDMSSCGNRAKARRHYEKVRPR
jgi:predicted RNA-binding Zn ribbon-like protein